MPTRIAALGDLHIREQSPSGFREVVTVISKHADVLLLCGDLTDHGLPVEAKVLADDLRACTIPILAVLGNHDYEKGQQDEVRSILKGAGCIFLEESPHEIGDVGFAGTKGFGGGFDSHVLQAWGEDAVKLFARESIDEALELEHGLGKLRTPHKVVVLHYSPIRQTAEGEPLEIFPFLGSSRLVAPIDNFDVTMVFHGHVHRGTAEGKTPKGIPVYNVSLPLLRLRTPEHPYIVVTI